jgi:hypothetical protein
VVGLVREVAHVVDNLLTVHVAKAKCVFLIDKYRVVGMAYLTSASTHHQFAVAANGEVEATFVHILSCCILADASVTSLQVAECASARLQR